MSTECGRIAFDDCVPRLVAVVRAEVPDVNFADLRVVRDMNGRLYLTVLDEWDEDLLDTLRCRLHKALGPYSPGQAGVLTRYSDTLSGDALYREPSLVQWVEDAEVHVVERRAMGQDWVMQPAIVGSHPPRFVFHSLKGGVGRSTALLLWGRELVRQGRTVLLVDLDLEAPGLGAHTLRGPDRPDYGVLDWLVEDLVGNSGRWLSDGMVAASSIVDRPGLWVAPVAGSRSRDHPEAMLAKLARAYLEGEDGTSFAGRLQRMVAALETQVLPDVVLVDSRAGLHETVAANLLHLDAEVFLFAVDVPATWEGYRYLFAHLAQLASVRGPQPMEADWRQRLHMVQARFSGLEQDCRRFASSAYGIWVDTLYDAVAADEPAGGEAAFSFDESDTEAPHWPLAILRSDQFEAFNPIHDLAEVADRAIHEVFGEFFDGMATCLSMVEEERS